MYSKVFSVCLCRCPDNRKMPIMLVIEYMNGGDLLRFLRKPETHLNLDEQLSIILQVAQAMVYLVSEK